MKHVMNRLEGGDVVGRCGWGREGKGRGRKGEGKVEKGEKGRKRKEENVRDIYNFFRYISSFPIQAVFTGLLS